MAASVDFAAAVLPQREQVPEGNLVRDMDTVHFPEARFLRRRMRQGRCPHLSKHV